MTVGNIRRDEINGFLADHGIYHAKEVKFTESGYTVVKFRREEISNAYIISQEHPGQPIIDEETFTYGN